MKFKRSQVEDIHINLTRLTVCYLFWCFYYFQRLLASKAV